MKMVRILAVAPNPYTMDEMDRLVFASIDKDAELWDRIMERPEGLVFFVTAMTRELTDLGVDVRTIKWEALTWTLALN